MYINNTKVKKILNESLLKNTQAPLQFKKMEVQDTQNYILDKVQEIKSTINSERKKPVVILEEGRSTFRGRLKFFKEEDKYGFITDEENKEDVFVHLEELEKAGLSGWDFKVKTGMNKKILVSFSVVSYIGKNGKSKKAVDIKVVPEHADHSSYQ